MDSGERDDLAENTTNEPPSDWYEIDGDWFPVGCTQEQSNCTYFRCFQFAGPYCHRYYPEEDE